MCMQLRRGSWMLQLRPLLLTARATLIAAARMRPASVTDGTAPGKYSLNAFKCSFIDWQRGADAASANKMQPIGERG